MPTIQLFGNMRNKFKIMKRPYTILLVAATLSGLWLMTARGLAQTTVFSDNFTSGSTLNSLTPSAPIANATSYDTVSTLAPTTGMGCRRQFESQCRDRRERQRVSGLGSFYNIANHAGHARRLYSTRGDIHGHGRVSHHRERYFECRLV